MLVRASVHVAGLRPGESGEVNGNDRAVRAALNSGFLEKVEDESKESPVFDDSPMTETTSVEGDAGRDEIEDD